MALFLITIHLLLIGQPYSFFVYDVAVPNFPKLRPKVHQSHISNSETTTSDPHDNTSYIHIHNCVSLINAVSYSFGP